jgi:hypothetical protein
MKPQVIQIIAVAAFSVLGIGCATTRSVRGPQHSSTEVELALQDTERSAFARMAASTDPETAEAARRLALGEER